MSESGSRLAVVLIDPAPAELHDGVALAAFLRAGGDLCQLRLHRSLPALDVARVAEDLADAGARTLLLAGGSANLVGVLRVIRLLPRSTCCYLFGRQLSDPHLRARIPDEAVSALIVGDPFLTARALARRPVSEGCGGDRSSLPGLLVTDRPFVPRQPLRDLDRIPPGDYRDLPQEVALHLPLHASRGYPHPCAFLAERAWEEPVRRRSVAHLVGELEHHTRESGARHFLFTDLCLNTSSTWLVELAQAILERELRIHWYGRIWPDPLLDRPAVHLLRRSGCRGLEVDLYSGSAPLGRELATGVDPAAAGALLGHCQAEGVAARVRFCVGLPGETDDDRVASLFWLERNAASLAALLSVGPCAIRQGAPLRTSGQVHFPADGDPAGWHDGGANNPSQRTTWARELVTWAAARGIALPAESPTSFSGELGQRVLDRLTDQVRAIQTASRDWRDDHLLEAGILHGREAFCGPPTLQLDLVGMTPEPAMQLMEQAAELGTRNIVLGPPGTLDAATDPLGHPDLDQVLGRARELGLDLTLRTALSINDAGRLRQITCQLQSLEVQLEAAGWERVERWLPVVTAQRAEALLSLPQLTLRCQPSRTEPEVARMVRQGIAAGVDRLVLQLAWSEEDRLTDDQRQAARQALQRLLVEALVDEPLDVERDGWPVAQDALFVPGSGWPAGFVVERGPPWTVSCPAGARASGLRQREGEPATRHALFAKSTCTSCELLAGCPVDRVDFSVRLPLVRLEAPARHLSDLEHPDSGFGRAAARVDASPCLVGWEVARVDAAGRLYACPEHGGEPLANVLETPLSTVWYGRPLNELRQMSRRAAKALPYLERRRCGEICVRQERFAELLARIEALTPEQRELLAALGDGERRHTRSRGAQGGQGRAGGAQGGGAQAGG